MSGLTPVTVIGGFLGAGKTTLVNHILTSDHGLRIAVLVNDFGEINIDAALIENRRGGVYSLTNGCVCCSINQGLVEQLEELMASPGGAFDHIVIEASGLSDPLRIMNTVRYARFGGRLRADAVVAVVDAVGFAQALAAAPSLAATQVEAADIVLLNKCDLADRATLDDWRRTWAFPGSRIVETVKARLPLELLFDLRPSDDPSPAVPPPAPATPAHPGWETRVWRASGQVDLPRLRRVLETLPSSVYRVKGVVRPANGSGVPVVIHLVGSRLSVDRPVRAPGNLDGENVLVFVAFGALPEFDDIDRCLGECLVPSD